MPDHDAVAIYGAEGEFAHLPGFVGDGDKDVGAFGFEIAVIFVGVGDAEVSKIIVAAEVGGRKVVRTFAEHDHAVVFTDKNPARRLIDDAEAKKVDVKFGGAADVMHREDVVVLEDGGHGGWGLHG